MAPTVSPAAPAAVRVPVRGGLRRCSRCCYRCGVRRRSSFYARAFSGSSVACRHRSRCRRPAARRGSISRPRRI